MDDEKAVAEEMRRNTTEGLTVKKKRKVEEGDSERDEAGPPEESLREPWLREQRGEETKYGDQRK